MIFQKPPNRSRESGFSLIDAIIGVWGISIATYAIMLVIFQSAQFANQNEQNDLAIQLARNVMEDIKTTLLNVRSTSISQYTVAFRDDATSSKSSVCGTIYTCNANNPAIILSQIGGFGTYTQTSVSPVLSFRALANNGKTYEVKISATIPDTSQQLDLSARFPGYQIPLHTIARRFEIHVKTAETEWSSPTTYRLEAYLPIP